MLQHPPPPSVYRCQSAYKLIELDAKFSIFKRSQCNTVLDLAAAPGGFAQVALERMHALSASAAHATPHHAPKVIGVDLRPIDPLPGLVPIRCNILNHQDVLRRVGIEVRGLGEGGGAAGAKRAVNVVLHDGVSVVSGQRSLSVTYSQNQMTLSALQLACKVLQQYGSPRTCGTGSGNEPPSFFVTKIMRSRHFPQVLRAAKSRFVTVEVFRPAACRPSSPETYAVMWGLRGGRAVDYEDSVFSLAPLPEDARAGPAGVVWFCLGCGKTRVGCRPCPACLRR